MNEKYYDLHMSLTIPGGKRLVGVVKEPGGQRRMHKDGGGGGSWGQAGVLFPEVDPDVHHSFARRSSEPHNTTHGKTPPRP